MIPPKRINTALIFVVAVIGILGLAFAGLIAWLALIWFPHSQGAFYMYTERGSTLYEQGNYQGAIKAYTHAIQLAPRRSRGYALRAQAYYHARAYREALADYDQVTKYATFNSTKRDAYYNRGACFRELQDWARSIPEFTIAIRMGERGAQVYGYRGDSYFRQKEYTEALNDLNRAIQSDPGHVTLYVSRSNIFLALHRNQLAVYDLAFAVRLDPRNAALLGNLGWAQYLAGKEDLAIQTDRRVLKSSDLGWVHANLGLCYAARENWVEALPEYTRAVQSTSMRELEGVTQDVRDALNKQPHSTALHNALAMLEDAVPKRSHQRRISLHR